MRVADRLQAMLLLETDDMPAAWSRLQTILAEPWHAGGDETNRYATWDARMGSPCVVPATRWLNLELYGGAASDDDERLP